MWRPATLQEALEAREGLDLEETGDGRYRCPNCRTARQACAIVDVRALPIPEEWACDCCWTDWERHGRPVDGREAPADRRAWRARWAAALGAPAEVRAKIEATREAEAYRRG